MASGIWHLASGIWHLASGIWHLASEHNKFDMRQPNRYKVEFICKMMVTYSRIACTKSATIETSCCEMECKVTLCSSS